MNTAKSKISAGFSLIELMVGMTIGLITVLVVSQVMQVAESRRQSASSGADTIVNATLGLYTIERDGRNAGYGLTSVRQSIGCEVRAQNGSAAPISFNFVPVVITDGATGAPDTLRFFASNKNGVTLPTRISADHAKTGTIFFVESDLGVQTGDMMVAVPATLNASTPATSWCTAFQVAGVSARNQIPHASGASAWNQAGASSIMPNAGYLAGDYVINLGDFVDRTYSINSNALRLTEFDMQNNETSAQDVFPNVVQLQAVYGKDTSSPPDNIVDVWNAAAPASAAEWQQIRAIRVAIVARSQNREPDIVTLDGDAAASTCDSTNPHPAAVCWRPDPAANGVKIDVSSGNADWQHYRYRIVETTVPLRNVIWQQ